MYLRIQRHHILLILAFSFILGSGCTSKSTVQTVQLPEKTSIDTAIGSADWIPDTQGPWNGAIMQAVSSDGVNFSEGTLVMEQAGVPNLLRLQDGTLLLTYQYFSKESEDLFDVIAYSVSSDNGTTWSDTEAIEFENLPEPVKDNIHPMDPTMVQLTDGRLRLYFTYHAKGEKNAVLFSATTSTADIHSRFIVEPTPALRITVGNLLDPAVIYFNEMWHHYSWQDKSNTNYHSTSSDGISFTQDDDIVLPMDFLGQIIIDNEELVFYGTSPEGIVRAFSVDGYIWEMEKPLGIRGADPAIQKLPDDSYIMVYTTNNFNQVN